MFTYENFEKIRKNRGLRNADVSRGTGIAQSTFTDWKKGRCRPKTDKLIRIADFLGCSLRALESGVLDPVLPHVEISDDLRTPSVSFAPAASAEQRLIDSFRQLNEAGQNLIAGYVDFLAQDPQYKKFQTDKKRA